MAVGSAAWGHLSDRLGARWTCFAGSLLLAVSLKLASTAQSPRGFQLTFSLGVGFATSAMFAPVMACVTGWFTTRRNNRISR